MASAVDTIHEARNRLISTQAGLSQVENALDNLIRYVNAPLITIRRARELTIESVGMLGASHQGEQLALRSFKVTEQLQLLMQALHNLKDTVEDMQLEVTDLRERTERWEGDLRG
jgi:hypothetical protein